MKDENLQSGDERMLQDLKRFADVRMSGQHKRALKGRILSHARPWEQVRAPEREQVLPVSVEPVKHFILGVVSRLELGPVEKACMKERIFESIEKSSTKVPSTSLSENFDPRVAFTTLRSKFSRRLVAGTFVKLFKPLTSAVVMVLMIFGVFSFMQLNAPVVMAFSQLDDFTGEVSVQRDGESVEVYQGMDLFEKDLIFTGQDGWASIVYFHDNVTRLAGNSELVLNQVSKVDRRGNYVDITLNTGIVWSRVLKSEKSLFVVRAMDVYAEVENDAAFNVEFSDAGVEFEVFDNSIQVHRENYNESVNTGQKAVVSENVELKEMEDGEQVVAWIQDNLENDEKHLLTVEDRLLAASEGEPLLINFDDVEEQKREFEVAKENLFSSVLNPEEIELREEDAIVMLEKFSAELEKFDKLIEEVSENDEEYADELRAFVSEELGEYDEGLREVAEKDAKVEDLRNLIGAEDHEEEEAVEEDAIVAEVELEETVEEIAEDVVVEKPVPMVKEDPRPYGVKVEGDKPLPPGL